MPRPDAARGRFLRLLLGAGGAPVGPDGYRAEHRGRSASLSHAEVSALASSGLVRIEAGRCHALPEARNWLRRQDLEAGDFAGQHRLLHVEDTKPDLNLLESTLGRLASTGPGETKPFLASHHVAAAARVLRLAERAHLMPRVTMSYSPAHRTGSAAGKAGEIGDMAADARRQLRELHSLLPRECAEVVLDVIVLEKGLQQLEGERGWPRRSAKLVLRIALERLAELYGLEASAEGPESHRPHKWSDGGRPAMFK